MTDFKWTPELQQTFDRTKKELTDGTLRKAIPNSDKPFYNLFDASIYGIGAAMLQKNQFENSELASASFRLFSTTELRLSTILCERSAIIYELSEYEFLIQESQHPIFLHIDHKTILLLLTQKNKPNQGVYKFQLNPRKFPNFHTVWTEVKKLSLPDLLFRSLTTTSQDKHRPRTVEIPVSIKFFMTHS